MLSSPPFTGNRELDTWMQEVAQHILGMNPSPVYNKSTGIITDPVDESIIGFSERYLHVKYADDRIGTNFSNVPTNRFFYGIKNDASPIESTSPADYTWFEVPGGFGPSDVLFFRNLGGRQVLS